MKAFYVIEDDRIGGMWRNLVLSQLQTLPTKPKEWDRTYDRRPEGEWTLDYGVYTWATDEMFANAGLTKPDANQLPAIYCVAEGKVESAFNVATAEEAAEFIRTRIC